MNFEAVFMMFARLRLHFQVAKVPQTLSCVHNLPCNANGRLCMTRQNFSAAASNRNATSSSTTIEPSTSPPNPVGQAYHAIIFKGRGVSQTKELNNLNPISQVCMIE